MLLTKPKFFIEHITPNVLKHIEKCARVCYKSEDKITDDSYIKMIKMLANRKHLSTFEHSLVTIRFICDRGISHELVRHRLMAISQESSRYVNYKGGCEFIKPFWIDLSDSYLDIPIVYNEDKNMFSINKELFDIYFAGKNQQEHEWLKLMCHIESLYANLIENGWPPEKARSILPNSTKTEVVFSTNLRELMHILTLRTSKNAHPQFRELSIPLLKALQEKIQIVFDDINND